VIYLDTSAMAKLVVAETESAALAAWLDERPDELLTTSVLGRVELLRAARRRGQDAVARALSLLAELALVPVSADVVDGAWTLDPPAVRSLDALHLASASSLGSELTALVAYDARLLAAAESLGLKPVSPGAGESD